MELENALNEKLVDLFNHLLQQEEQALRAANRDLSMREIHCLEQVCAGDGQHTMGDVAEKLGITLGTLTVCVNRLEFKGYVRRRRDTRDRRVVRLNPTEKARRVNEAHQAFHMGMIRGIIGDLSAAQLESLWDLLTRIEVYFARQSQS